MALNKVDLKCSTNECYSVAVSKSKVSGKPHCIKCSIKLIERFGIDTVKTIDKLAFRFPWEADVEPIICERCGLKFNKFFIAHTGDCPSCAFKVPGPFKYDEVSVTYEEGKDHD